MRRKRKCGAYARSTGNPCQGKALRNGRCLNHGGNSTGPKSEAGRRAVGEATRQRMASGQGDKAKAGFQLWLDGGGRDLLSRMATNRARRKRWLKEIQAA